MSETKFTGGEWTIDHRGNIWSEGGEGTTKICDMRDMPYQSSIYRQKTELEHKSNANLISKAPAMYREIEKDVENLKSLLCDMNPNSLGFAATVRKIDRKTKLLTKARGEL